MTSSTSIFVLTGLGVGLVIASSLVEPPPILVWNATVSAPRGLYCIAPLTGLRVCEDGGVVTIEGRHVANALSTDERGRPMVSWSGCRALSDGEFFALNADVPTSLDGRYFGPSPLSSAIGRAIPVWTVNDR